MLISAAIEIMKERNSIHFSVRDVTDRAGVNSSLVRYHFGSKEGLEISAFETSVASSLVRIADICGSSNSPVEKLSSYIELVIAYSKANPYAHQLLTSVIADLCPDHSQRIFSNSLEFMIVSLGDIINEGVRAGVFTKTDSRLLFFSLCGACVNLFASTSLHKHVFGPDELPEKIFAAHSEQLKSILLRGLSV